MHGQIRAEARSTIANGAELVLLSVPMSTRDWDVEVLRATAEGCRWPMVSADLRNDWYFWDTGVAVPTACSTQARPWHEINFTNSSRFLFWLKFPEPQNLNISKSEKATLLLSPISQLYSHRLAFLKVTAQGNVLARVPALFVPTFSPFCPIHSSQPSQ
eukprot:scaffold4124_cov252-Pinguiococcus_pyrenoidosus.AAC.5